MHIGPITLEGTYIRLVPLSLAHHGQMCEVGLDPDLWGLTTTLVRTPADMRAYIEAALKAQAAGTMLPFATIEKASSKIVGSSRYGNIDTTNRRLEIGWTWVAPAWQRSVVNTEAKYLRNHMITPSGRIRHSVYFSIIDSEWPEVKGRLEEKIARWSRAQGRG